MPNINEIDAYFNEIFPQSLSLGGDCDGLMLKTIEEADIDIIVVSLDITDEAINFAVEKGAKCIVSHHPLIYYPITSVSCDDSMGKLLIKCIKNDITVLSYHTRLDAASGGVNDCLCDILSVADRKIFESVGRLGSIKAPIPLCEFADIVSQKLSSYVEYQGDRPALNIAVMSGNGKGDVRNAYLSGADTLLTGEVNYHAWTEAAELGINLITGTHYGTEVVVLPFIKRKIKEKFPQITVFEFAGKNKIKRREG